VNPAFPSNPREQICLFKTSIQDFREMGIEHGCWFTMDALSDFYLA